MNTSRIKNIRQHGKTARGKKELIKHLEGQKLTVRQAIYACCYDCCGFFSDGKIDCRMPLCPLHPYMPYNEGRQKQIRKRTMTKAHMEKMRAARQKESNLLL